MSEIFELNNPLTDSISDQQILANVQTIPESNTGKTDLELRYGFILGGYGLLIPEDIESEVVSEPKIFSIPNTSELMIGLISVRGQFAPVFDLGKMLSIQLKNRAKSIIVLNMDGNYLAFPFERALSLELPSLVSDNNYNLPDILNQFSVNIYQTEQDYWTEFDFKLCIKKLTEEISHH